MIPNGLTSFRPRFGISTQQRELLKEAELTAFKDSLAKTSPEGVARIMAEVVNVPERFDLAKTKLIDQLAQFPIINGRSQLENAPILLSGILLQLNLVYPGETPWPENLFQAFHQATKICSR